MLFLLIILCLLFPPLWIVVAVIYALLCLERATTNTAAQSESAQDEMSTGALSRAAFKAMYDQNQLPFQQPKKAKRKRRHRQKRAKSYEWSTKGFLDLFADRKCVNEAELMWAFRIPYTEALWVLEQLESEGKIERAGDGTLRVKKFC